MANLSNINNKFIVTDGNNGRVLIGATNDIGATLFANHPSTTAPSLTFNAPAGQVFENEDLQFAFGLNNASPYNGYMQTRFVSAPYYRNFAINPLGGDVGIGTNSPDGKLHVQGTNSGVFIDTSTAYTPLIKASGTLSDLKLSSIGNGGNLILEADCTTASIIQFNNGGSERMRIDSSGRVGIGVTNPDSYDSNADNLVIGSTGANDKNGITIVGGDTDGRGAIYFADTTQNSAGFITYLHTSNSMLFGTSDSTALTIDSSGNSTFNGNVTLSQPTNGSDAILNLTSKSTAGNSRTSSIEYDADNEYMYFKNAGTTVATMTSAGNVGIGTTSPDYDLEVYGTDAQIFAHYPSNSRGGIMALSSQRVAFTTTGDTDDLVFGYNSSTSVSSANFVERMRIDNSSGNVGIGTTSPWLPLMLQRSGSSTSAGNDASYRLCLSNPDQTNNNYALIGFIDGDGQPGSGYMGLQFTDHSNNYGELVFGTRNSSGLTERMRITSGGDIEVTGGSFYNSSSGITVIGNGDEFEFVDSLASGAKRFRPSVDNSFDLGDSSHRWDDVWATNPAIQTSDRNEKNTIKNTDLGLDFINKLKPVSYIWNNKTRTHYGLIAQDVEDLLSEINKDTKDFAGFIKADVSEEKDNTKHSYGLRYNEFISPMIKAIQEQQEIINDLKNRIETLENK